MHDDCKSELRSHEWSSIAAAMAPQDARHANMLLAAPPMHTHCATLPHTYSSALSAFQSSRQPGTPSLAACAALRGALSSDDMAPRR
jgi:hypothetical protein